MLSVLMEWLFQDKKWDKLLLFYYSSFLLSKRKTCLNYSFHKFNLSYDNLLAGILLENLQIHLSSFISGFTFAFPLVKELSILNVSWAKFFCSKSWTGLHFNFFIGFHIGIIEYSSPIKRMNGSQISKWTKHKIDNKNSS